MNVAGGFCNIAINGTLTYTAAASENFGLTVNGADSTVVTLDGGMRVPILRIDTTAADGEDGPPLLPRVEFGSGHGNRSTGDQVPSMVADICSSLFWQLDKDRH